MNNVKYTDMLTSDKRHDSRYESPSFGHKSKTFVLYRSYQKKTKKSDIR